MKHKTGAVVTVISLVFILAASFSFGPPATATTDRFHPTVDTGRSQGSLYTAGEAFEQRSITVGEQGAVRTEATIANTTGIRYWNGSNESVYRVETENSSAVDRIVNANNDSVLVDRSKTTAVIKQVRERPKPEEWWNDSLVMIYLQSPEYERVRTETQGDGAVAVYEPSSSYVRIKGLGGGPVRVLDPSGEVVVDDDTGRLLAANVSYEIVRAESWGEYLLFRATGESIHIRVTYEYQPDGSVTPVDRTAS